MHIVNIKTNRYKLSASGNIILSILNYKLMLPFSNLWLPREQKFMKKQQSQEKKLSEKTIEGNKK